jgi:hypothetical protein
LETSGNPALTQSVTWDWFGDADRRTSTELAGGLITATTLTGSSGGGTTLNQINQLANLGTFTNTGAGGFALTDGRR